jgi:transcriptional regulator with XRE-family HTH domain
MDGEIGERIREARIAHGMSQADLAATVGVSNSYLSHIEAGRRPVSEPIRLQIAAALGVAPIQLEDGVPSDQKEELRLKLSFAEMALRNGNWELAKGSFGDALAIARTLPLDRFVDEATWGFARALEATGQLEDALEQYEDLLKRPKLSAAVPRMAVRVALVRAYNECGDLARAIDLGEQALADTAASVGEIGSRVELICTLAGCYVERGDLTRASLLIRQASELAEQDGSLRARAAAAWEAAVIADSRHDGVEARLMADRALALYEELDNQRAVGLLRVVAAGLFLRQERPEPEKAEPLLERALAELTDSGTDLDLSYLRTEQARAQLLAGRAAQASETAEAALAALPDGDRLQRGRMLLLVGHAARAQGKTDDALAAFRAAADYLRQAGAARQAATAWRELGEAYVELGRPDEAIESMRRANDLAGVRHTPHVLDAAVGQTVRH